MISNLNNMKNPSNKYLYAGFLLIGLFSAIFSKDFGSAMSSWGIALAFNPWSQKNWKEVPIYQKAIFIVHFVTVIALIIYWIISKWG
jgi:hypothetical protein